MRVGSGDRRSAHRDSCPATGTRQRQGNRSAPRPACTIHRSPRTDWFVRVSPRIAFNAQLLSYRQWYRSAGISRYIDRTLAHLAPLLDPERLAVFVGPDVPIGAPSLAGLRIIRTRLPTRHPVVRIAWEQIALPLLLGRWRADLLHAPAYVAPLASPCPTIITFHDLSFYLVPEAFNRQNRFYLQTFSRLAARRARRIIAVSECTRSDVIRLLGIRPEDVAVVYNGVDPSFRPEPDPARLARFRQEKGLPDRFILFLGTLEPRKNLRGLLYAYAEARRRGVTEPLIIAGGRGWQVQPILRVLDELGLRSSVRLTGFVGSDEQPLWYNAATLFAFPSRYEGFGLPVVEAMACGTPVVASNRASLPEIVGDAGVLVDPDDVDKLATALVSVLRDEALRRELARRGLERARRFSWEAAARATVTIYHEALAYPHSAIPVMRRD
jgi:glycosyltransferase involved in cell wall biosynthesis